MVLTHHGTPLKKITVTHRGTDYQVENCCSQLDLFQEENAIWNMALTLTDEGVDLFTNKIDHDDEAKVYINYAEVENPLTSASLRFHGFFDDLQPLLTMDGEFTVARLRSYSRCIVDLLCKDTYGTFGRLSSLDTIAEILNNAGNGIIPCYVNHLLGDTAKDSGYTLDYSLIEDIAGTIPFQEYPFKPAKDSIDDLLDMLQAVKGATTAGAHWIVKPEEAAGVVTNYFLLGTVGNHPAVPDVAAKWPTWWNTDQAGSTIVVKQDMVIQNFMKQRPEANYILYAGNFRKPGDGDYWSEDSGGEALWGEYKCLVTNSNVQKVVGSHSLKFYPDHAADFGVGYYPSTHDAAWDLTKIGTSLIIPTLDWYEYGSIKTAFSLDVYLFTHLDNADGSGLDDYFWFRTGDFTTMPDAEWVSQSYPVGPYWRTTDESRQIRWGEVGTPLWTEINGIGFQTCSLSEAYYFYIDGLHFSGHVLRGAKKLTTSLLTADAAAAQANCTVTDGTLFRAGDRVTISDDTPDTETNQVLSIAGNVLTMVNVLANNYTTAENAIVTVNEFYKIKQITDHIAKDDSLVASDDSGTMAQMAKAELFRSSRTPITGEIEIPWKPILPGQKAHIHACKTAAGAFRIDKDMRIITHHTILSNRGLFSRLTLTDDLYNSRPMRPMDAFNLVTQATDLEHVNTRLMSSTKAWTIDSLQEILGKTYSFAGAY